MTDPFVLGVNYWPRRKAMYWWPNFDADEVREEFDVIAGLGMTVVRIFLLWDDWQPTPDSVSADCLKHLGAVCDIAAERHLGLDVTFFTGHMSGPNWAPGWLLADGTDHPSPMVNQVVSGGQIVNKTYRNMYHDAQARAAEELLLTTVVSEYKDHDAVYVWNLGNEPDLFAWPNTPADGRAWVKDMTALIKDLDSTHPVTCGLHIESIEQDNHFRINEIYAETDVAVMHGYPMYQSWSRDELDPDFVPFMCALSSAFCGKPTMAEEWGGCTAAPGEASQVWEWTAYGQPRTQFMASEDDFAEYIGKVLPKLIEVGSTGSVFWCYADYIEDLWDKPPCKESKHERFFGLVRPDGSLKPHAEVIKQFAATNPTVDPNPTRTVTLDVTPDEYYANPKDHAARLYQDYLRRYEGDGA